jgi:hypothetical protein
MQMYSHKTFQMTSRKSTTQQIKQSQNQLYVEVLVVYPPYLGAWQ